MEYIAHLAPLPMELLSKNTGMGCHFLLQGIFPTAGIKPAFPAFAGRYFVIEPCGNPIQYDWLPNNKKGSLQNFEKINFCCLSQPETGLCALTGQVRTARELTPVNSPQQQRMAVGGETTHTLALLWG